MMLQLPAGNAICYSGYREGQSPDARIYPSVGQIREDLHLLARHWQLLRLYDSSPHAERVQSACRSRRLSEPTWLRHQLSKAGAPNHF